MQPQVKAELQMLVVRTLSQLITIGVGLLAAKIAVESGKGKK